MSRIGSFGKRCTTLSAGREKHLSQDGEDTVNPTGGISTFNEWHKARMALTSDYPSLSVLMAS